MNEEQRVFKLEKMYRRRFLDRPGEINVFVPQEEE